MNLEKYISEVKDFPEKGIIFKDITTALKEPRVYQYIINEISKFAKEVNADVIVGPEARGFIVGCPVAFNLGIGFVPVRKPDKLPRAYITESYDLEYGSNHLSIHVDDITPGQKVVICDDLLATGGTILATIKLIEKLGGIVVGIASIIELVELGARERLAAYQLFELIKY